MKKYCILSCRNYYIVRIITLSELLQCRNYGVLRVPKYVVARKHYLLHIIYIGNRDKGLLRIAQEHDLINLVLQFPIY